MKRLLIIVRTGSAVDSFLADAGFIYEEVFRIPDKTYYMMNISKSLQLIDLLVSKFCIKDFFIQSYDGVVTFRVRS